ncbi:MAG: LysR family transcriptional regulator [Rhodobacteraceae bacterium]|nr:LysR family transcriptional regulator [Paracoccaceae bacterium]
MTTLRRLLPSIDHLEAFDLAGRLGSFGKAAQELRISQAAISYAIRELETDLGTRLFVRSRLGVTLTEAGLGFHREIAPALAHIRHCAEQMRRRESSEAVSLSVSTAFATWWVLPRLGALRADLPDLDLRVQTTDRDLDLRAERLSLGIRYGTGVLDHYETAPLAPEVIHAVASPEFIAGLAADVATPADIPPLRLIHLDEPHRACPTWASWFAAFGLPFEDRGQGLRVNDYALAVLAALDGQGVVLGWAHLLDPLLASGRLVPIVPQAWRTGVDFMLVWHGEPNPETARVRDWLVEHGHFPRRQRATGATTKNPRTRRPGSV